MVCSLQSAVCSLQSAVCGLQSAVCSLQSAVCGLRSAVCGLQSAVCSLQMSYTVTSLRRRTSWCCSQPVSRMLATVLEWLTDFLTGAIMESRKAARSKAVASPPCPGEIRGTQNICSEDDLRSRNFGTFVVKFHAYLPLLGFSNITAHF